MAETINQPLKSSQRNLINPFTGLLSKAADTALEIALVREGAKAGSKRAIGTISPSGQLDPARVQSNKETANQPQTPIEKKEDASSQTMKVVAISVGTIVVLGVLYLAARKGGK